ncbi:uncharacterized, partial [Tachysurus ichikawai]
VKFLNLQTAKEHSVPSVRYLAVGKEDLGGKLCDEQLEVAL